MKAAVVTGVGPYRLTRRSLLAASGGLGVAAIAGCATPEAPPVASTTLSHTLSRLGSASEAALTTEIAPTMLWSIVSRAPEPSNVMLGSPGRFGSQSQSSVQPGTSVEWRMTTSQRSSSAARAESSVPGPSMSMPRPTINRPSKIMRLARRPAIAMESGRSAR